MSKKHFLFFILNLLLVTIFISLIIYFNNGKENDFPYDSLGVAVLISMPIVYLQYPILNLKNNWLYKSVVLYLSMLVFLFVFGIAMIYIDTGFKGDTIFSVFYAGAAMSILGQVFGFVFGFLPILIINYIYRNYFFR